MSLKEHYGSAAVITGAARGIGFQFASALAREGFDLLLTDVDGSVLDASASMLRLETGSSVETVQLDMREPSAVESLAQAAAGLDLGLAICNHLCPGGRGPFLQQRSEDLAAEIDANVRAYSAFLHAFGRRMRDQSRGGIIMMSSMTGVVGSPYVASYGAAKSYVLALGGAVADELRDSGVDLLVLVPGAVNTETFQNSQRGSSMFRPMEVEAFVVDALRTLGQKSIHTPGRMDAITSSILGHVLPRRTALRLMGRNLESMLTRGGAE